MMQMVNACQNGDSHLLTSHYGQVRLSPEGLKFSLDCPGDRNPSFAFVPFLWLVYAFCMGVFTFPGVHLCSALVVVAHLRQVCQENRAYGVENIARPLE